MKIRVTLAALTRVEYSEVIEVPDTTTYGELDDIVHDLYENVDGGLFEPDPNYWERGNCYWEKENEE